MTKLTPTEQAREIVAMCRRLGWQYSTNGSVLTIQKRFTPGDNEGLVQCDMEYGSILGLLHRTSSGSDWGTDCGGIGAMSALNSGYFRMQRSGGSKRVLAALAKM